MTAARMIHEPIETSELWNPTRDRVGTADGVDLEPLQHGMAEIAVKQHEIREGAAYAGEVVEAARPRTRRVARTGGGTGTHASYTLDELIAEEVEDYEIEAACELPRAAA